MTTTTPLLSSRALPARSYAQATTHLPQAQRTTRKRHRRLTTASFASAFVQSQVCPTSTSTKKKPNNSLRISQASPFPSPLPISPLLLMIPMDAITPQGRLHDVLPRQPPIACANFTPAGTSPSIIGLYVQQRGTANCKLIGQHH